MPNRPLIQPPQCPTGSPEADTTVSPSWNDARATRESVIEALELIEGWLPPRAMRLIGEWASAHREELRTNWDRARAHEPLAAIAPLPSHPNQGRSHTRGAARRSHSSPSLQRRPRTRRRSQRRDVRPDGGATRGSSFFRRVRVDAELGTVTWPNGFDLDPDVLHGDHQPAAPINRAFDRADR